MTAQEIYEKEGFLILSSDRRVSPGFSKLVPEDSPGPIESGTRVVVVGEATSKENRDYCKRYGFSAGCGPYFYKVIAE